MRSVLFLILFHNSFNKKINNTEIDFLRLFLKRKKKKVMFYLEVYLFNVLYIRNLGRTVVEKGNRK